MLKSIQFVFLLIVVANTYLPLVAQDSPLKFEPAEARFRAMERKDTLTLKKLLADDLAYVHSNGLVESKSDFIRSVGTGKIVYEKITGSDCLIKIEKKVAVVTGIVDVDGLYQGNSFKLKLRYLSVYRKRKGQWELMRWQSLKI